MERIEKLKENEISWEIPLSQDGAVDDSNLTFISHDENFKIEERKSFKLQDLVHVESGICRTNDEIHLTIEFCSVIKAIIDTPHVQRLRQLKQLGTSEYVYVNCTHTRFEHSLGVMHLAEKMCRRIKRCQPELKVSGKDILCVKIAGLLHDLGHGPYSHVFEQVFENSIGHEIASLMMIDSMLAYFGLEINENELDKPLKQIGDGIRSKSFGVDENNFFTSRDWIFIKECIISKPIDARKNNFVGRERGKEFLYDIVSNRHNGLDVDKMDYFARDKKRAFGSGDTDIIFIDKAFVAWSECIDPKSCQSEKKNASFPRKRLFDSIINDTSHYQVQNSDRSRTQTRLDKHLMVCYPTNHITHAVEFFQTRFRMHSNVYRHKKTIAVEYMLKDILKLANPHIYLYFNDPATGNQKKTRISEAINNPNAYLLLNDSILDIILWTSHNEPKLHPARDIINLLKTHQFYKQAHRKELGIDNQKHKYIWEEYSISKIEEEIIKKTNNRLSHGDVIVHRNEIHHGCHDNNPVSKMRFLDKPQISKLNRQNLQELPLAMSPKEEEYEAHLPRVFLKRSILVFCREESKRDLISHAAEQFWFEQDHDFTVTEEEVYESMPAILSQDGIDENENFSSYKKNPN